MRSHPYVVVLSGFPPEADFLLRVLDDLELPTFSERDIQPGERWAERLRTELNTADVVLVGAKPPEEDLGELENTRLRRASDPAFMIIPVVSGSESKPDLPWLQGVKPLVYEAHDPARTITSLVKSLTPEIEATPEVTLEELLAEAQRLVLRLKSTFDQYRHSLILLSISFVVFASGVTLVTIGIRSGAANPLSGFYQLVGLVVLPLGGFFLLYSIVNWNSTFQRKLRSQRLIDEVDSIVLAYESFRKDKPSQAADQSGRLAEMEERMQEHLETIRAEAEAAAREEAERMLAEYYSQQSKKEQKED